MNHILDINLTAEHALQLTADLLADTTSTPVVTAIIKNYVQEHPNQPARWLDHNPLTGSAGYFLPVQYQLEIITNYRDYRNKNQHPAIKYTEIFSEDSEDSEYYPFTTYDELNEQLQEIDYRRQLRQDYNDNKTLKANEDNGEIDRESYIKTRLEEYIADHYCQQPRFTHENTIYKQPHITYIGIQSSYGADFQTEYRITYDSIDHTLTYRDDIINGEIVHQIHYERDIDNFIQEITPYLNQAEDQIFSEIEENNREYEDEEETA
jgi:hypothetical protein